LLGHAGSWLVPVLLVAYKYNVSQRIPRGGFLTFSPKRLGIISPNFIHLSHVPIYAILQIYSITCNFDEVMPAILSVTTQHAFRPKVDILSMMWTGWLRLIWH